MTVLAAAAGLFGLTACGEDSSPRKRPKKPTTATTGAPASNVVTAATNVVESATPDPATTEPAPAPVVETGPRYAEAIPGKPGFVYSPYVGTSGPVDVRDANGNQLPRGTEVRCPYTRKTFLVP